MSKLDTVVFRGISGSEYEFGAYSFTQTFKDIGAVYIATARLTGSDQKWHYPVIYIGQAAKLGERLEGHERKADFLARGANTYCVKVVESENERSRIETDLIARYQPPCNVQGKAPRS